MSIPIIAGPIGYDSWYVKVFRNICEIVGDPKKFVLDWIASDRTLVVHTDRLDDVTSYRITSMLDYTVPAGIEVVRYNHHIEVSWRDINKYAACTNVADMLAVNPDYKNDLTSDGEWIYPLPEMVNFAQRVDGTYKSSALCGAKNLKRAYLYLPKVNNFNDLCRECSNLEYMHIYAPVATSGSHYAAQCHKLKEMEIYAPNYIGGLYYENGTDSFNSNQTKLEKFIVYMPRAKYFKLAYTNSKLTTLDGEFPSLLTAPNFAPGAILKKIYATKILNSLPTWTDGAAHEIKLGIHIDHQNDPEVLAAIHNAEAKGWTLTVQWNPGGPVYTTPTA